MFGDVGHSQWEHRASKQLPTLRGKEALGKEMEWRGSEGALETEGHFGAGRFISGDDYTLRTLHPPLAPGLPPPIPLGGSSLVI